MNVGISTASYFFRLPVEDTLLDIGEHGVRLVEVFLNSFSEYEEPFSKLLFERVQQADLSVYSIHPMSTQFEPQLFSPHPRQREDAFQIFKRVLKTGRRLGAKVYVMHGAAYLSGANKNLKMARNYDVSRLAAILGELSDLAAEYGIALTLENVSWCAFSRPEIGAALADALGDRLHYTLDVKQALRAGEDPLRFVEALGSRIVNLHLCDAKTAPDGTVTLAMPGKGDFDFAALNQKMKEAGCTGPAFMEVYNDMYSDIAELYESYAIMQRVLA